MCAAYDLRMNRRMSNVLLMAALLVASGALVSAIIPRVISRLWVSALRRK
jgi:hypothetical protein